MRHTRERHRRRTVEQQDLFGASPSRSGEGSPAWEALPAQARAELTTLMIRLIVEYAHACTATAIGVGRHER